LVSDWAVAEADREQLDVNNISSIRFILLNILPHIRFPCMAHEKLAIEVRNSGILTAEELTDLFAYCLSGGKTEIKYVHKARVAPQIPITPNSSSNNLNSSSSPGYPSSQSSSPPLSSPSSSISKDNVPPHYRLTALPSQQQKNRAASRKNSSEGAPNGKSSVDSGNGSGSGENPGGNISSALRRSRPVIGSNNNNNNTKSRTRSD